MLDTETKRRIDTARDILVGKVPDPKSQVEQITIALIYKFMDDMDAEAEDLGGKRKFFSGEFDRYGWKKLMAADLGGFEVLNLYAEAIQKMNINPNIPQLFRDIFKNAFLPYRDPETLKSFLKIINDFEYDHSERLGDAFEYLLSVLGSQGDAGQFRTPRHIIDFMVDIIDPKKDETIIDPACGTAGFLISSYKHIVKHNSTNFIPEKDPDPIGITGGVTGYKGDRRLWRDPAESGDKLTPDEREKLSKNIKGYDISPDMVRLSLVNLYLHGFKNPKIVEYDTLTSQDNWNDYADIILANPPFMSPKGGIKPHKRFSIQSNRSEVLFVDYMVEHLTTNGKAAIIVPEGIIFQSGKAYKQLRKMLVQNYLFAVVSLPAGVFQPYSGVKTSILLIDKSLNKKTDKILFVKIENDGFDLGAQRRPNNKSQLPDAVKLIKEYILCCHSALDAESILTEKFGPNNLWNITAKEKIGENDDWNLSGERYRNITEFGKLSYELIQLGNEELFQIEAGGTPSSKTEEYWNGGIPWMTLVDLPPNDFITKVKSTKRTISQTGLKNSSAKIIPKNSVIVSTRATIGRVGINEIEIATNQGFKNIIIKNYQRADTFFVALILKSLEKKMNELATGGTFKELTKTRFMQLKIPLPPLEIQKEIVAEIEGWQKIIDGARQVVENYKPQIDIDPEWQMETIGEMCELFTGGTPTSTVNEYYENGTIKWLVSGDIHKEEIFDCDGTITQKGMENSNARWLPINSVLIALNGQGKTRGAVAILRVEATCNQSLIAINPINKNKLLPEFLFFQLKGKYQEIRNLTGENQRSGLNMSIIRQIKIFIPSIEIQNSIIEKLEKEKPLIKANLELVPIFEQKIKDKIAKIWGE